MPDGPKDEVIVNIAAWVERASNDPPSYLERQATEVLLAAIGTAPSYNDKIFLKGGILMGVRYESPRQTADIDFSTTLSADPREIDTIVADHPRPVAPVG